MIGLDAALAKFTWLDGNRMAALGASYGGYMINWINGKTDRFKALVCHDGNLDERMAYFDTEELWFPEWEHGGTAVGEARELHQAQPDRSREELEDADARDPRRRSTSASSTPRACRRSPRSSARASRASSSTSPTRTTGCSSRRTASCGTTRCSAGSIAGPGSSAQRSRSIGMTGTGSRPSARSRSSRTRGWSRTGSRSVAGASSGARSVAAGPLTTRP